MLVKFFARGKGSGSGAVDYLTRKTDPITKKLRNPTPEVMRFGNASLTAKMIDEVGFSTKYTSGVLSFAPEDAPSEKEQQELMEDFEAIAFAGIGQENHNVLWVRHQHTGNSRVELHFLVPRAEPITGKSLNIAPPGWKSYYYPWQNKWNLKKGWARPDDPGRGRVTSPGHTAFEAKRKAARGEKMPLDTRAKATAAVEKAIAEGRAKDRTSVLKVLQDNGFEVVRKTNKSITIKNQEWQGKPNASQAKVRLKSQAFYSDWTLANQLNPPAVNTEEEITKLEAEIKRKVAKRADYNAKRYHQPKPQQENEDPHDYDNLQDFLTASLGDRAITIPPSASEFVISDRKYLSEEEQTRKAKQKVGLVLGEHLNRQIGMITNQLASKAIALPQAKKLEATDRDERKQKRPIPVDFTRYSGQAKPKSSKNKLLKSIRSDLKARLNDATKKKPKPTPLSMPPKEKEIIEAESPPSKTEKYRKGMFDKVREAIAKNDQAIAKQRQAKIKKIDAER